MSQKGGSLLEAFIAERRAGMTCPACNGCGGLASRTANMFNGQVVSSTPSYRTCETCSGSGINPARMIAPTMEPTDVG